MSVGSSAASFIASGSEVKRRGKTTCPPGFEHPRDFGILLRRVGLDGAAYGHWMESPGSQIIEGGRGDSILVAGPEELACRAVGEFELTVHYHSQYPIAPPSLRGSEPPIRTPCSRSIRMAW
jgi:hypothetical protein